MKHAIQDRGWICIKIWICYGIYSVFFRANYQFYYQNKTITISIDSQMVEYLLLPKITIKVSGKLTVYAF